MTLKKKAPRKNKAASKPSTRGIPNFPVVVPDAPSGAVEENSKPQAPPTGPVQGQPTQEQPSKEVQVLRSTLQGVGQFALNFVNDRHKVGGAISTFERDSFANQIQAMLEKYSLEFLENSQQ